MSLRAQYKLFFILIFIVPFLFAADNNDFVTVKDTSYGNYWDRLDAIERLGKKETKEAIDALIILLDDKEAPIREAAVTALSKMRNKEMAKYFADKTLNVSRIPLNTKANACLVLGLINDADMFPCLVKALDDTNAAVVVKALEALESLKVSGAYEESVIRKMEHSDHLVRIAAIRLLIKTKSKDITDLLVKKLSDRSDEVRGVLLQAIAAVSDPGKSLPHLLKGLTDASPEVKIAALESLTNESPDEALKCAIALLDNKNWQVRSSAVGVLRKIRRPECLNPLVTRLSKEGGRLRYDIVNALQSLTGRSFGYDAKKWESWLAANKNVQIEPEGLENPSKPDESETISVPRFFEIPVLGESVIFIIDFSGSMKAEMGKTGKRRIDIAQEQLALVLKNFKPNVHFNIILMSTEALRLNKRQSFQNIVPATDQNKQKALDFVSDSWKILEDIKRGRGDMYNTIIEAFKEKDIDTVFLLSDGKPTYGEFIEPDNILKNLSELNRYRKVVIHTIQTGSKGAGAKLMKNIAELTNGVYVDK
ncbi:MAG: HEAT repeat domain-containing protein [Planctomycetes bacterium]|nr:HEAT repeat domain-containing protein [Planctomycetota bacterium]